jgi:glycosyltransferase involved in cell wall biosynthesis
LYQFCSLFAFLPLNEPLGVVVMEAIAANKPVVAFAKGGPMETILPNINGFLCHSEDEYFSAIASILQERFQVDPAHGFDYISARFSASAMQHNFLLSILKN